MSLDRTRYKIVRFYQNRSKWQRVIKRGLTLERAQEWCRNPESSSKTAKGPVGRRHTRTFGEWFDGYDEDNG